MKILHVIPSLSPRRGGPSFTLRAMARALAEAGLEIHIAATDDDGPDGRLRVPLGQPLVEDGVTSWYFPRQTRFYTASWPLTQWLARHTGEYDLVHIHALFSYASMPAAFYAVRYNVPYLVRPLGTLNRYGMHQRRPWLKQLSFQLIERRIIEHATLIHYTSEQERKEAAELGVDHPSVVIPNPVELPTAAQIQRKGRFRQQHPWLAERTLLLFLSRLDPKKGLDLLLPAFAQLKSTHPDVALVIAGEGKAAFVTDLQKQARQLGIAADIVWTGFVAGGMKQAVLADADIFVLPSYSENFGNVVIEAMAHGLPVVISDQVGIYQEIVHHGSGLATRCNRDDVSLALHQLVANHELRQHMGTRGVSLASTRFSLQATTAQLIDLYTEVIHMHTQGLAV